MMKTQASDAPPRLGQRIYDLVLSVPVNTKVTGIMLLPVLILGFSLNYWMTSGLSDWLSYLLSDARVEAAMEAGRRSVTLVTVLAAAASILLAAVLTYLLTRPLRELRAMAIRVAEGEVDARARVYAKDEIGDVATAINTMTNRLVQAQTDLTRSNRRLSAINRVIQAADRELDIHDVLFDILEAVLDVLNLEVGWVYLRDPDRNQFHLASWRNVAPDLGARLIHAPGQELCRCQRMLLSGELSAGVALCACERMAATYAGARQAAHFSLPIEAGDLRLGVVNLLCVGEQRLSDEDRDLLAGIGAQISEVVSNAWLRLKLAEKEKARQALLESLVDAQEDERGRLARELHDGAGQMLTTLLVRLKTMERQADSPAIRSGLASTLDMVSQTIEQVRDLSHRLRPAALEELGLEVALRTLVADTVEEAGMIANCQIDPDAQSLPRSIEVSLYRIAQEALTNVLRHARAQVVDVTLSRRVGAISLLIHDDGLGFSPDSPSAMDGARHLGLVSMRERADKVNATLSVESAAGKGTTIRVVVPIEEGSGWVA
ncbi:MAG TPA: histidine kinase [Thermoflexales bacterium]|nr:histidine kinase [Thermoflexales bacterium]HQX10030.1 histidine kinase [Thermoflexales bacterium]HQY25332.1 histidine kinase [Thermoflexales bacterium]HQZ55236.1 histidine kinase [Thermoflexales bacterium]HRA54211.1 histidine kinase [Thermoflexales bacterium]